MKIRIIELSHEDKLEITIKITAMLLSNLSKSITGLPKNKSALLKKIGSVIKKYANSDEISFDYKQTLDRNKQVRFWVFDFLQHRNVIIWDKSDGTKFEINKDQMLENLKSIQENHANYKEQLSHMMF